MKIPNIPYAEMQRLLLMIIAGNSKVNVEINSDGYWVINGEVTGVKAQGEDGKPGANGITPTVVINSDGYWVINGEVTGVKAQGENGKPGTNGKDAYEIALEHGFEGTESEWLDYLNGHTKEILTVNTKPLRVFVGSEEEYESVENKNNLFAIIEDDPMVELFYNLLKTVNIITNYVNGTRFSETLISKASTLQTIEGFPCELSHTYPGGTIEAVTVEDYLGLSSAPTVIVNGDTVRIVGFSSHAGRLCQVTISYSVKPVLIPTEEEAVEVAEEPLEEPVEEI